MRKANLTQHAAARLGERSKLSPENLKRLLDNGVTVPVALQKRGRHAKRRLASARSGRTLTYTANDAGPANGTVFRPL